MSESIDPIADAAFRQLGKRYQEERVSLQNNSHVLNRSFKEKDFILTFLPYFCGELQEGMQVAIATWIGIAGSAMGSVNLLDATGKVVAIVPPIGNIDVIDPSKKEGYSVGFILQQSAAKSSISPRAGINNMVGGILGKIDAGINKDSIVSHYDKWSALLARYGKKLPTEITEQAVQPQSVQSSENDFDYE